MTSSTRVALRSALAVAVLALSFVCAGGATRGAPAPDTADPEESVAKPKLSWQTGEGKSYSVPVIDIVGFEVFLNLYDEHVSGDPAYDVSWSTIRHNLRSNWVIDNDPFDTNQFLHPYQGATCFVFARSAGLSYWQSLGYSVGGSALWELAGENTPPSKNDLIATGIGGSFFGESLFRMASLLLEHGGGSRFWRELGAAAISPAMGFNRLTYGERFRAVFPGNDPAFFTRFQIGAVGARTQRGVSEPPQSGELNLDFSMEYGLPGKGSHERPFDLFTFQLTGSTGNIFENILSRGLLVGRDHGKGEAYRSVRGLYGSYDYIAPQVFRVSSTAFSYGVTAQRWLSDSVALLDTLLLGVGYGAAGTIHGAGERDYHYGITPQALVSFRVVFGDRVAFDVAARDYYVSRLASTESRGWENLARAEASLLTRFFRHGIALKYVWTRREASYPDLGDRVQARTTLGIFYTFLNDARFGAVDWRAGDPAGVPGM